jgi:hypothetical protein
MNNKEQKVETITEALPFAKMAVSNRFSIIKTILSDFALFAIVDNQLNKVVCHLAYDNGEEYCEEMANKMLVGLNGCLCAVRCSASHKF